MNAMHLARSMLVAVVMAVSVAGVHAAEPAGVPADKPYQVAGVIEWIDLADNRLVVDGTAYRYHSPVVHAREGTASREEKGVADVRLQPGMKVGLRVGRGDPRPILEVWILR